MSTVSASSFRSFALTAAAVTALLLAVGLLPTRRLAGLEGIAAMFAGGAVALIGSLCGGIVVALRDKTAQPPVSVAFGVMGLRLAVVVLLGLAVGLTRWFSITPLLVWFAIAHIVLLAVDTRYVLGSLAPGKTTSEDFDAEGFDAEDLDD
jgi:hypothetical protein